MGTIGLTHPLMATPELPRLILASSTSTIVSPRPNFASAKEPELGIAEVRRGPSKPILRGVMKATERALGSLPCAREPWLRLARAVRSRSKRDSILGAQPHRLPEPAFAPPAAAVRTEDCLRLLGARQDRRLGAGPRYAPPSFRGVRKPL